MRWERYEDPVAAGKVGEDLFSRLRQAAARQRAVVPRKKRSIIPSLVMERTFLAVSTKNKCHKAEAECIILEMLVASDLLYCP